MRFWRDGAIVTPTSSRESHLEQTEVPVQFDRAFKIGDAARFMGLSPQSLRDYEAAGAISPARSSAGTRSYGFNDLTTLENLRMWRQLGKSLKEATELVRCSSTALIQASVATSRKDWEQKADQVRSIANRLDRIDGMLRRAPADGLHIQREPMDPLYVLALVRHGQPVEDKRLDDLVPHWLEHVPSVFYANVFQDLSQPRSSVAGLAVHTSDVFGWDPQRNGSGLVCTLSAKHAVHGFGWRNPGDDELHDVEALTQAAPRLRWGKPRCFIAESLLSTNGQEGQHIFWSQWLLY